MATITGIERRRSADIRRLVVLIAAAGVACLVVTAARAQVTGEEEVAPPTLGTFVFGVKSSIGATDNVTRSPTDEISDVIASIGAVGEWSRPEGRLRGEANWDVSYYSYLEDTYDEQVFGGINLFAEYDLVGDWLSWMVQENFGQVDVNPFQSSNPGNVQNVNYFSTGPDLTMRLGERTTAIVTGRYSNLAYEITQGDNERLEARVSLRRQLSETVSVSLNGSAERVEYRHIPPGSDFDRQEAYAGFTFERERTTIGLEGGMNWLHDRGETFDGPLYRVTVNRKVGGYSNLSLHAGQEFSDAGDVFRYGNTIGGSGFDSTDNLFDNPDPFEREFVTVGWTTDKERTQFATFLNWSDESYETLTELDRELYGWRAELTHALTLRTNLTGSVYFTRQDYQSGFESDEWRFDVIYGWQIAQPLYVDFTYRRWVRTSQAYSGSAIENMFFVTLTYNFAQ